MVYWHFMLKNLSKQKLCAFVKAHYGEKNMPALGVSEVMVMF